MIHYGRRLLFNHPDPNDVRIGLNFSFSSSQKGVCAYVTQCPRTAEGSHKLPKGFAKVSSIWLDVLDSVGR
jgi:hypothetical protein